MESLETAQLVVLRNRRGMEVRFHARGGIVRAILAPDRHGVLENVVLGFDDIAHYADDRFYLGALIGRNANRIANAQFVLDGTRHLLTQNDGVNHLHGGTNGFSGSEWTVRNFQESDRTGAELLIESPDGDQGYPGGVRAFVRYALTDDNAFIVQYRAMVDAPTPLDLTQHSYFNLAGAADAQILNHELQINATMYTPVNASLIPTGEIANVADTPFDFREPRRIGERIDSDHEQLRLTAGYDHNYVLDDAALLTPASNPSCAADGSRVLRTAAVLRHADSGRMLTVLTTAPAIQVYTGNELDQIKVRGESTFARYAGIALETQHFPDTPNQPSFPTSVVRPGDVYSSETIYQFSVCEPYEPPVARLVVVT